MKYQLFIIICVSVLLFATCQNDNAPNKSPNPSSNMNEIYLNKGKRLAATTFSTLSNNLQKAMKEGGVQNAVKYCNISATTLVDSLQNQYHATIKRTSLKARTPKNQPTKIELKQLQAFQKQMDSGQKLQPVIQDMNNNKIAFFAPIHVMPLCQKCHGKIGDTLLKEDYQAIKALYPEDKAVDYKSGDLRGMWSIEFLK